MSEDRKIGDLPASDSELNAEAGGESGARGGGGQPSPEATQPSPDGGLSAPPPRDPDDDAQRTSPPHDPTDVRGTHPGEPFDPNEN